MKNLFVTFIITFVLAALPLTPAFAQESDQFVRAEIVDIVETGENEFGSFQIMQVELLGGDERGRKIEIEAGDIFRESASRNLEVGEVVVIRKLVSGEYSFAEIYRIPQILIVCVIFLLAALLLTRTQGIFAVLGLLASLAIIVIILIPWILSGGNALLAGVTCAILIAGVSMTLAHGINARNGIALLGTGITLIFSAVFAFFAVRIAELFGIGSEAAMQVQLAAIGSGDFRGILLAGILLGAVGVLDDVTVAQATVVAQLKKTDPRLTIRQLYTEASVVGKEHLLSMMNTLLLAYAGAALPLFLLFATNDVPVWVTLNSEAISEEIVRTLVGSTALLFGVPITTFAAAWYFGSKKEIGDFGGHVH